MTAIEDQLDDALQALHRVKQWADAYPTYIFPEPDIAAAKAKIGETEFMRLHAAWARHLLGGIGKIVNEALKA